MSIAEELKILLKYVTGKNLEVNTNNIAEILSIYNSSYKKEINSRKYPFSYPFIYKEEQR